MSIFNNVFGKNSEDYKADFWQELSSEADLQAAVKKSFDKKVVIFKHSTCCFISKTVLKNFENEVKNSDKLTEFYFLDLLQHRELSNKIADDFGVPHQSPQLIVLEKGKAVRNASHQDISLSLI